MAYSLRGSVVSDVFTMELIRTRKPEEVLLGSAGLGEVLDPTQPLLVHLFPSEISNVTVNGAMRI